MIGVAGYLLGLMEEFGVSFGNAWWFLGLVVMSMVLTGVSIGHNHKTISMFGLLIASFSGFSFFRMQFHVLYRSVDTVGLPIFFMFVVLVCVIAAYELLMHALPDMPVESNGGGMEN